MKTKEELDSLKEEVEALNKKLAELTDEELVQVSGGRRGDGKTTMECSSCKYSTTWGGDYCGQVFDCPVCGEHTFKGIQRNP